MRKLIVLLLAAVVVGGAVFWFLTIPQTVPARALSAYSPDLANGREMFFASGCGSCHAVLRQDDKTRLGGGLALKSPYGIFYAPNISPDPKDGIGSWSEADFVTAMVKGTSPDGRHYFPTFPYPSYQRMADADVRDLFAYLKTLPPVQGKVRDHAVRFPYNIRRLVGGWKFLFLDGKPFQPNPAESAQWNRGAYLINGPAHCAECHSPRNFLGGIVESQRFAGGPDLESDGWVPNITGKGLAKYSQNDLAYFFKTGMMSDGDSVGAAMTEVVLNTAQLSDNDHAAMAEYLKSLRAIDGPPRPKTK